MNCVTCGKCRADGFVCTECRQPVHKRCLIGCWCVACLAIETTQEKAWALADTIMRDVEMGSEYLVAARAFAAGWLLGPDPEKVRALFGEPDPLLEEAIANYLANGIWTEDGHICMDELPENASGGEQAISFMLPIMCGAGVLVWRRDAPAEPPASLPTILA